jgi:hypothetical protein
MFSSPENIHTKVSLPQESHTIEAPSCFVARSTPSITQVKEVPSFPYASYIRKTGKTSCYSTKPTHISSVLCVIIMVTRCTDRTLGSQASITTTTNTKQVLVHSHTIIIMPLLGSPKLSCCYQNINHSPNSTN